MKKKPGVLLSCADVHALVSQGLDRELPLSDRTKMRMHMMICSSCTNFNLQMRFLRMAMRNLPVKDEREEERP